MKVYDKKDMCCGCTACMHSCPKGAIDMIEDEEGFLYPRINGSICINCGICVKVCPFIDSRVYNNSYTQKIFAAKNKDLDVVLSSSSGGVFTALSDYILDKNGVVYGAAFDENFVLKHIATINNVEREKLKKSKYVQSYLGETFTNIKEDLTNNKLVMFSGTPCQNAGLKEYLNFIKVDTKNLYTCDFVCHGTPSPKIWIEYVSFLQKHYSGRLTSFTFRGKKKGWKNTQIEAMIENKDISRDCNKKYSFLNIYKTIMITRPACYNCKFTNYNREGDITIADFWNIENTHRSMDNDIGVSLVMLNSEKGLELFNKISYMLTFEKSNEDECWQAHLEFPVSKPRNREKFWNEYYEQGSEYIFKKYGKGTLFSNSIKTLTPILKKAGLYNFAGKLYNKIFSKK